jgi:hypothetical protein
MQHMRVRVLHKRIDIGNAGFVEAAVRLQPTWPVGMIHVAQTNAPPACSRLYFNNRHRYA